MKNELSFPWNEYYRLQRLLLSRPEVDDRSWGYEEALDRILESLPVGVGPAEIERISASAGRRERSRGRIRRIRLVCEGDPRQPEPRLEARDELKAARDRVTDGEWNLLAELTDGRPYSSVASETKTTEGALRTKVARIRQKLAA
jgi:hypothetical protein